MSVGRCCSSVRTVARWIHSLEGSPAFGPQKWKKGKGPSSFSSSVPKVRGHESIATCLAPSAR